MAGGKLGELYVSLDIRSKIDHKLRSYRGSIGGFTSSITRLQKKIENLSKEMDKLGRGSDAWKKSQEEMRGYFRSIDAALGKIEVYERAVKRVQAVEKHFEETKLLGPQRQFTSLLDTKPLEEQIKRQERAVQIYKEMERVQQNLQTYVSMGARNKNHSVLGADYAREKQKLDELKASFDALANGRSIQQVKESTQGLYTILGQYERANEKASAVVEAQAAAERRRATTLKDARIAYEELNEAYKTFARYQARVQRSREESGQARRRETQALRAQTEALLRNREAALLNQKAQLGRLYSQGRRAGLGTQELETILARYKELARALFNIRWTLQNSASMPLSALLSAGRLGNGGGLYVQDAATQVQNIKQQMQESSRAARDFASAFDRVHSAASRTSGVVSDLKNMFLQGGLLYGAQRLANNIVQQGGMIEQQHIALRAMLGDVGVADKLFGQIKDLAINSPFTFSEMIRDTKQLVAFGVEEENVYETTKRLADISAGLGVSFERLGLAFGQVKARGWLDGKELRQFAYAGLPLLSKLSQLYTKRENKPVTTSEVRTRITKRNVPFEDVREVLWELTNAGGQFYEMQDVLTNTLLGKYNKLKDAWDIMLSGFTDGGNVVGGTFKMILDATAELIGKMNVLSPMLVSAAAVFGGRRLFGAAVAGLGLRSVTRDLERARLLTMQRYSTRQMELALEGRITAQQMEQHILDRQALYSKMQQNGTLYAQLAIQGSLRPAELARLLNNKHQNAQIQAQNAQLMRQLQLLGLITARQGQMILNGNRVGLAFSQIGAKLGGLLSWGNMATVAITALGAIGMSVYQFYEHNKQLANEAAEQAASTIKNLREQMDKMDGKPLTEAYIGKLTDVLKQSNEYTASLDEQIHRARTLGEKYDIIKSKLRDLESRRDRPEIASNALTASKYGDSLSWYGILGSILPVFRGKDGSFLQNQFFNEGIEENIKDVKRAEEALRDLEKTGVASARQIEKASAGVRKAWREIALDDVPRMVESIQKDLHQVGIAWKDLGEEARHEFGQKVIEVIDRIGLASTKLGERLYALMMAFRTTPELLVKTIASGNSAGLEVFTNWFGAQYRKLTQVRKDSNDMGNWNPDDKKSKRRRGDRELERVRNRVELYKKFYSEYKKLSEYTGEQSALQTLSGSGDFKSVFGWGLKDVTGYAAALDTLTESLRGTTEERRKFLNDASASKAEKNREDTIENIKKQVEAFKEGLDIFDKRYSTYKDIVKATGNREVASAVAYGQRGAYAMMPDRRTVIQRRVADRYMGGSMEKAGAFLDLPRETVNKQYGQNSELAQIWQEGHKETVNDLQEALKLYEELVTKHNTIEEQIANENRLYEERVRQLEKLKPMLSGEDYNQRLNSLDETHEQAIADLSFKQFKQSSGWEQIFRDLDRVSTDTLRSLEEKIRGFMLETDTSQMSEEGVKALVEALDKVRTQLETRTPFASIADGYKTLSYVGNIMRTQGVGNDQYRLTTEQASRLGLRRSKNDLYNGAELRGVQSSTVKGFANAINGVKENFDALQSVLQPVVDLFDQMGATGLGTAMKTGQNALNSAVSVAGGLTTLSNSAKGAKMDGLSEALGKAGPYAAAAAAGISIATSLLGGKSSAQKAYEKQAAYLKSIESTTNDINQNLKKQLQEQGGSTAESTGRKIIENYQTEAQETRNTYLSWSKVKEHRLGHRNRTKTKIDFDELNNFLYSIGWNGELVNGETAEDGVGWQTFQNLSGRYWQQYKEAHAGSYAKINEQVRGWLDKLIEIEGKDGKIEETTKNIAEAMTDMNFDNLKSEYESLLDNLDSSNEDFAQSFEKHMRKAILSTMLENLYAEKINKIIEQAQKASSSERGNLYIARDGSIRAHTGGDDSANVWSEYTSAEMEALTEAADNLGADMRARRDMLQRLFGWSDDASGSMSSSIKNISEETADVLSSYVNAMRADLSIVRQLQGEYLPKLDVTATAQLQQLSAIQQNTQRGAAAAERIETAVADVRDMLSKAQNDVKSFSVRVK